MLKKKLNSKPVTLNDLGEFTEQVILPGVEEIIRPLENKVDKLEVKIDRLTDTVTFGFADIKKSFQVLGGDIAELKEQKLDDRVRILERKAGVR